MQCRRCQRLGLDPWIGKSPWRREWQSALAFLSGKSHGQRSLAGYSPCGRKEPDTTERLHLHIHSIFTCIYISKTIWTCFPSTGLDIVSCRLGYAPSIIVSIFGCSGLQHMGSLVTVSSLPTAAASLVAEPGLRGFVVVMHTGLVAPCHVGF